MHRAQAANEFDAGAQSAFRAAVAKYFARPYVTGVDLGIRVTDGVLDTASGPTLRVHVAEKRARRSLKGDELIPRKFRGMRTDVVQARYRRSTSASLPVRGSRVDPLQPGIQIGVTKGDYGTLGAFVRRGQGEVCLLTAAHVATRGATDTGGRYVFQPQVDIEGAASVAQTLRIHRGLDAAICRLESGMAFDPVAIDVSNALAGMDLPIVGQVLQKSGAASCITQGIVDGLGEYRDPYVDDLDGVGPAFRVVPESLETADIEISLPGDSGAVWFDPDTFNAIGLHVRGPDHVGGGEHYGIATLMISIADVFEISFQM